MLLIPIIPGQTLVSILVVMRQSMSFIFSIFVHRHFLESVTLTII